MRVWRAAVLMLAMGMVVVRAGAARGDEREMDRRIEESLKRGVGYLLSQSGRDFSGTDEEAVARTGRAVHALLSAGRAMDDRRLRENGPELSEAIAMLTQARPVGARAALAQVMALCLAQPTAGTHEALMSAQKVLALKVSDLGASSRPGATQHAEESRRSVEEVSEIAQGLAVLDRAGIESSAGVWKRVGEKLREGVEGGPAATGPAEDRGEAAARAAGLLIVRQMGEGEDEAIVKAELQKIAEGDVRGLDWGTQIWTARAAQRAGMGWIAGAAERVVGMQRANGAWRGDGGNDDWGATCDALLLLAMAREPVVFSKLQWAGGVDERPYDCAILTQWMSQQFDKPLAWQVVTEKDGPVFWGAAPVLLIEGGKDPAFDAGMVERLRAFVEAGGIIFSTANGGNAEFTETVTKKYMPAVGGGKYEVRALAEGHPLFGPGLWAKIGSPPKVIGVSNGVRELWIHSAGDMGASWQGRRFAAKDDFYMPANLIRYATGMGTLRNRFQPLAVEAGKGAVARTIELARVSYEGNSDPEPGAWRRLAMLAATRFRTRVNVHEVGITELDAARTPVAHMTGTGAFTLNAEQLGVMKKFLAAGGTLIADASGGSKEFSESFHLLMTQLYPDLAAAELAGNDPLYNGSMPDSFAIGEVEYRKFAKGTNTDMDALPHLQAVTVNGRHVIVFSRYDVTSGLLGTEMWGVNGFAPDSAVHLAQNMLLYGANK